MDELLTRESTPVNRGMQGMPMLETETEAQKVYRQRKHLFEILTEVKNGNFTVRMPLDETTQKIRREARNNTLPIIAVTANAMKGDKQKCMEAGASDCITKPVKIDQLLSLMRLWLNKK